MPVREFVGKAIAEGLRFPSLPLCLDITLAGVLSVGGIGSNSTQKGFVSDAVERLEVVTEDGEVVLCLRNLHPELFRNVLGGWVFLGISARSG